MSRFGERIQPAFYVKTDSEDAKLFLEYIKEQRELEDKRNEVHIQFLRDISGDFKKELEFRITDQLVLDSERNTEYTGTIKSIIDDFQKYSKARQDELVAHLDKSTNTINDSSRVIIRLGQIINSLEESKDNFALLAEENTKALNTVVQIFEQKKQFQFILAPFTMVIGVILGFVVAVIALME